MTLETRYNGDKITADYFNSIKDELDFSSATANYLKVDANYAADMREAHIGIDASLNPVTVTLPTAVGNNGKKINIKSLDVTNAAVINDADANTLVTFASIDEVVVFVSDGTVWQLFSNLQYIKTHEGSYVAHREFNTKANLVTWASTAVNGSYAFATDEKLSYQVIDGSLEAIGGTGGISEWVSATAYEIGDQVYYTDNKIYRCITANSDVTFTPAKWQELSAGASDHALLINLQGGTTAQYYHLTATQHAAVINENYGKQTLAASGTITNVQEVELDGTSAVVAAALPTYTGFTGKAIRVYASDLTNACTVTGTFASGITEYAYNKTNVVVEFMTSDDGWIVIETQVAKTYNATDWADYTPVFQGFGTPTSVSIQWRQDGPDMLIKGRFIPSSNDAAEMQIGLANSQTVKIGEVLQQCGVYGRGSTSPSNGGFVLLTGGDSYINIGNVHAFGSTSVGALSPAQGTNFASTSAFLEFRARVPIEGWKVDADNVINDVEQLDNSLTAVIQNNGTATVVSTNTGWIESADVNRTALGTVSIDISGLGLTQIPEVSGVATEASGGAANNLVIQSITTSTIVVRTYNAGGPAFYDTDFHIEINKQGADYQNLSTSIFSAVQYDKVNLKDGIVEPSTEAYAQMYVDVADGDLKVKFSDGTVKTIVVDS